MGRRLSTQDEMMEALVDLIDSIDEKMKVTMPGTDYYVDLERQKEEFERQLAELTLDEEIEKETLDVDPKLAEEDERDL